MISVSKTTKNGASISARYDGKEILYSFREEDFKIGGVTLKWHFLTDNIEFIYNDKRFMFHPDDWNEICQITSDLENLIKEDAQKK